jgi:2-polyprenyl-3-methyl-5-hydroxy-6-metoxy-1,4-benzoquinol methylase
MTATTIAREPSAPIATRSPTLPFDVSDAVAWATSWDTEYFTSQDRFTYFHSASANVLFIDPVPDDRLSEIYPPTYYSFGRPTGIAQRLKASLDRRRFARLLRQLPGDSLSALDVGGGAGWVLDHVREADPRVTRTTVVDLDTEPAAEAEASGHEFFGGRIEEFVPEAEYDLVLLLNLIEHVADPLAVLTKIRALLRPHGRVLLKTPNFESLDARLFRHHHWGGLHCPRHWVLFNRRSLTELATLAGLEVTKFSYTQGAPFWTTSILAALNHRGLIRANYERPLLRHPLATPLIVSSAAFDILRSPFSKTSQMFFELGRRSV